MKKIELSTFGTSNKNNDNNKLNYGIYYPIVRGYFKRINECSSFYLSVTIYYLTPNSVDNNTEIYHIKL